MIFAYDKMSHILQSFLNRGMKLYYIYQKEVIDINAWVIKVSGLKVKIKIYTLH